MIDEMPADAGLSRRSQGPLRAEVCEGVARCCARAGRHSWCVLWCRVGEAADQSGDGACREIADRVFPEYKVGLLHGQMKADEKQAAIARFARAVPDSVCTTVVEWGGHPGCECYRCRKRQRYGLAQLHQLRGSGRSGIQSFCVLLSMPRPASPQTYGGPARHEQRL